MKKTRKNKSFKQTGGDKERFYYYANLIENQQKIDPTEFKQFLDSVENPLTTEFQFDSTTIDTYTINEWAFLHKAPYELQIIFLNYPVSFTHTAVYYPWFYARDVRHTILDAYVLASKYPALIREILASIKNDDDNEKCLFQYLGGHPIPTTLYYAFYSRNQDDGEYIFRPVFDKYLTTKNFEKLVSNNPSSIRYIFDKSITMNETYAVRSILDIKMELIQLIFKEDYMKTILLNDDPEMYRTLVHVMNNLDQSIISEFVSRTDTTTVVLIKKLRENVNKLKINTIIKDLHPKIKYSWLFISQPKNLNK